MLFPFLFFSSVLFCSIGAGVVAFFLIVCMCILVLALVCGCSLPLLGYIKPSGEPVVPRGPQLSTLSLRSSSCFSPAFPRCRPNPLAANGKPDHCGQLSKRQLRHRRRSSRLRQPLPHSAVLPNHRVALQQVGPRPPTRGRPGTVSVSGQYPEGPKVRKKTSFVLLKSALACWWSPLFCSLSTFTELTEGQIHQFKHKCARRHYQWPGVSFNGKIEFNCNP